MVRTTGKKTKAIQPETCRSHNETEEESAADVSSAGILTHSLGFPVPAYARPDASVTRATRVHCWAFLLFRNGILVRVHSRLLRTELGPLAARTPTTRPTLALEAERFVAIILRRPNPSVLVSHTSPIAMDGGMSTLDIDAPRPYLHNMPGLTELQQRSLDLTHEEWEVMYEAIAQYYENQEDVAPYSEAEGSHDDTRKAEVARRIMIRFDEVMAALAADKPYDHMAVGPIDEKGNGPVILPEPKKKGRK
jgi:hypothetical protein